MSADNGSVIKVTTAVVQPISVGGFTLAEKGLTVDGAPTFEEWRDAGKFLRYAEGAVHWWIGDWLNYGERAYGEKYAGAVEATGFEYVTLGHDKWVAASIEFCRRRQNLSWSHHAEVAALEPDEQDAILSQADGGSWNRAQLREAVRRRRNAGPARPTHTPDLPMKTYRCLVVDPPWDVGRSDRTARPAQATELDYATLGVEEIAAFRAPNGVSIPDLADPESCQLYLWTPQKYVPAALKIVTGWGFKYHCLLTWVKPTGMTPFSWMFNTEHVVFAYRGEFDVRAKGQKLSFEAPVPRGTHSAKPAVFFERVLAASDGSRLSVFEREPREGFEVWGNELPG
jgi:N6-adenosine-specific RNA methylase IME4